MVEFSFTSTTVRQIQREKEEASKEAAVHWERALQSPNKLLNSSLILCAHSAMSIYNL